MHLLYIPMNRKETKWGLVLLAAALLGAFFLPDTVAKLWLYHGPLFFCSVIIFHRFLAESCQIPLTGPGTILKFAVLGYVLAFLANLLTNDLIYYFLPKHFGWGETGPYFVNIRKEVIAACTSENFPMTAIVLVILVPVWEELIHRGLVFGTLVQKNVPLAYLVSTLLYILIPVIPLFGGYRADYVILHILQYIPISLMFNWIYTKTETILTPILAHILMNGLCILSMR